VSNFSSNTPIENIGALELGAVAYGLNDGTLEAVAVATSGPTVAPCTVMACPRRIDDGALEVAAVTGPNQTIITYCACPRVDDGELEASAGIVYAGPTSPDVQCIASVKPFCPRYIDDGALEAVAGPPTGANNCRTAWPCARIDDSALEAATVDPRPTSPRYNCQRIDGPLEAVAGPDQPTRLPLTLQSFCRRIDDGAFEAAAAIVAAPSYNMGCSSTQGQMCRRIDDDALEATAVMTASPSFDTVCGSTIGPRCFRGLDDGALEAIVVSAGPSGQVTGRGWTGMCCGRIDDGVN
jgi:hypothetical protein